MCVDVLNPLGVDGECDRQTDRQTERLLSVARLTTSTKNAATTSRPLFFYRIAALCNLGRSVAKLAESKSGDGRFRYAKLYDMESDNMCHSRGSGVSRRCREAAP